jgi:hypothetical protein
MKIDNFDFGWGDPDIQSCEPCSSLPGEARDEDMRHDSFPGFSDEAKWTMALRKLSALFKENSRKSKK